MDSPRVLRLAKNGYIIMSMLFCCMGLWIWVDPMHAVRVISPCTGCLFIANGIIKMFGYFSKDLYNLAFQYDLAFGILMAAVGIITIARWEMDISLLLAVCSLTVLSDALFKIQICIDAKRFGMHDLWWRILIVAIVTGALSASLLLAVTSESKRVLYFAAYTFLAEGILNILVAIFMIKILEIHPDGCDGIEKHKAV